VAYLQGFSGFGKRVTRIAALQSLQGACRFYVLIFWAKIVPLARKNEFGIALEYICGEEITAKNQGKMRIANARKFKRKFLPKSHKLNGKISRTQNSGRKIRRLRDEANSRDPRRSKLPGFPRPHPGSSCNPDRPQGDLKPVLRRAAKAGPRCNRISTE
jgi:hypothetical protein